MVLLEIAKETSTVYLLKPNTYLQVDDNMFLECQEAGEITEILANLPLNE